MRLIKSLMLAALVAFSASSNAAVILDLDVSDINPSVNDTITVNLLATTTTLADSIGGFTLSLGFDTNVLQLASPMTLGGSFLPGGLLSPSLFIGSSFVGASGTDIVLASFEFLVIGTGTSVFTTSGTFVSAFFQPILDVEFASSTVNVAAAEPVSAPATIALLLGALALVARRKAA